MITCEHDCIIEELKQRERPGDAASDAAALRDVAELLSRISLRRIKRLMDGVEWGPTQRRPVDAALYVDRRLCLALDSLCRDLNDIADRIH